MPYDPKKHHRRSIRLVGYNYSQAGAYFVTLCIRNRQCLLGDGVEGKVQMNAYGEIVERCWDDLPNHYPNVELDEFVVMPNHTHGIIVLTNQIGVGAGLKPALPRTIATNPAGLDLKPAPIKTPLSEIIRAWKTFSSRRINERRDTTGTSLWQRDYFEHIIRDEESLNRIREYIATNPLRWDLDRENLQRRGDDEFDLWLDTFKTQE